MTLQREVGLHAQLPGNLLTGNGSDTPTSWRRTDPRSELSGKRKSSQRQDTKLEGLQSFVHFTRGAFIPLGLLAGSDFADTELEHLRRGGRKECGHKTPNYQVSDSPLSHHQSDYRICYLLCLPDAHLLLF